jgi:hypothetical protein
VLDGRGDGQRLLRHVELDAQGAGRVGDQRQAGEQLGLQRRPVPRRAANGPPQELDALMPVPVQVPQPRQGRGEALCVRLRRPFRLVRRAMWLEVELAWL